MVVHLIAGLIATDPAEAFDVGEIPLGSAATEMVLSDGRLRLRVHTYSPEGCGAPVRSLVVFHGNGRGAESLRNASRHIADLRCLIVIAPLFDRGRFPSWRYHRGGLVNGRTPQPPADWAVGLVPDILDWARSAGAPPSFVLFGHSAGGQFLSRVAAYVPPMKGVEGIVIANPSTYVWPTADIEVPYGFGGGLLTDAEDQLSRYLSAPVTILLGEGDTGDEDLTTNRLADAQGANRFERGLAAFAAACAAARLRNLKSGWHLVIVPGVAHSARAMLASDAMEASLGPASVGVDCMAAQ